MKSSYSIRSIGEVADKPANWNPRANDIGDSFVYVDIGSIDEDDKIINDARRIVNAEAPSRARQIVRAQDVIVSTVRPNLNAVAFVPDSLEGATASTGFAVLRPRPGKVDGRYMYHWVRQRSFIDFLLRRTTGANYPAVSDGTVREAPIPLPHIEVQRRIAAILDKADVIRRKRRHALTELDALLRAAFLDMFGDPAMNPHGFTLEPVRKFGRVMTGNTPPRANPENFGSQIEWIKSDNISDAKYFVTEAAEGLSSIGRSVGRIAPAGSILVTCIAGSPKSIGTAALADREVAFNQQINAIIPLQPQLLGFLFVQIVLAKRLIQRKSSNAMKGMVTKTEFEEVCIMTPPEEQQGRFSEWFQRFVGAFRKLQGAAEASEQAFGSLSQRAFRGDL